MRLRASSKARCRRRRRSAPPRCASAAKERTVRMPREALLGHLAGARRARPAPRCEAGARAGRRPPRRAPPAAPPPASAAVSARRGVEEERRRRPPPAPGCAAPSRCWRSPRSAAPWCPRRAGWSARRCGARRRRPPPVEDAAVELLAQPGHHALARDGEQVVARGSAMDWTAGTSVMPSAALSMRFLSLAGPAPCR